MRLWKKLLFPVLLLLLLGLLAGTALAVDGEAAETELRTNEVALLRDGYLSAPPEPAAYALARTVPISLDQALYNALSTQQDELDVSAYAVSPTDFSAHFKSVLDQHPELFYVNMRYSYYSNGDIVTGFLPEYLYTGAELAEKQAAFDGYVDEILAPVDPAWSDLEKLLFLHDYLCEHYEYDYTYTIYYPEQFLTQKTGVCNAYALTLQLLLNELGIRGTYAASTAMNHIWNVVELDGAWYHIDVTWDDQGTTGDGRAAHSYFLLSDAAIYLEAANGHYGWTSDYVCTDTTYDSYFWQSVRTPFAYSDGTWYCLRANNICRWTPGEATADTVFAIGTNIWPVWGSESGYWGGVYSGFSAYHGYLLYNTCSEIRAYNTKTGATEVFLRPDCTEGYLYGFAHTGDTLTWTRTTTPNDKAPATFPATLPKVVAALTVATPPNVTLYAEGEQFLPAGLTLLVTYSDGATETLSEGFSVAAEDFSTRGEKAVTLTLGARSVDTTVSVGEAQIQGRFADKFTVSVYSDGALMIVRTDDGTADVAHLFVALYDGNGRMCRIVCVAADALAEVGSVYQATLDLTQVARINLLSLRSGLAPLDTNAEWNAAA